MSHDEKGLGIISTAQPHPFNSESAAATRELLKFTSHVADQSFEAKLETGLRPEIR